ncbi:tyrosine--tRNA ligase, partial [Candidatus Uhrbacteria bacterium]|nr:tyrosine--tRNA ligase [Candidatus Uhrbacteria bacterium]
MPSIATDPSAIDWFLSHAVENVYPSKDALREKLMKGERISIYLGIDPTGPTLHLGHMIPLQKLRELQDMGHQIILLIGDFTAMSGDPDKLTIRRQLTHEEVLENCRLYQDQAEHVLDFSGPNKAELRFNNDWLGSLSFTQVVELASHFTVQQMLERDNFEKRIAEQKPIKLHEFLYPLMQGYDSVAMDVDMELGGNDQTFNMLAGRTLMKELKGKEKFVLTTRLLADPTGKKMGKTEGNMITLADTPGDMYGKVMSWTDEMIIPGFEICTQATADQIKTIQKKIKAGENPMQFKHELARQVVTWLLGGDAATKAAEHFTHVHQQKEKPEEIKEVRVEHSPLPLVEALVLS